MSIIFEEGDKLSTSCTAILTTDGKLELLLSVKGIPLINGTLAESTDGNNHYEIYSGRFGAQRFEEVLLEIDPKLFCYTRVDEHGGESHIGSFCDVVNVVGTTDNESNDYHTEWYYVENEFITTEKV